jgi:cytochrome c oxidase subunit 1
VGFHHQFTDPGIPAAWKIIHSLLTMMVGIPSLLTAFTVTASMEIGAKRRGGKGVIGWIGKLPWRDASFTAQVLAMISFIFGGAGGMVNASFNLNNLIHNTAWVPGHFHITVGTATTLTFFGITFWLIPHLVQKPLFSNRLALAASWFWFVGMMIFALGMHWQGLLGVPRRAHIANLSPALEGAYANAALPQLLTGISGVVLLIAVILYFYVLFATLFSRKHAKEAQAIPFTKVRELRSEGVLKVLDSTRIWFALAVLFVIVAYGPTLLSMWLEQIRVPGLRLW